MTSQLPGVTINGSVNIAGDTNYVSPKTVCLIAKTNGDTPLTQMTKTVLIPSTGSVTTTLPENASLEFFKRTGGTGRGYCICQIK